MRVRSPSPSSILALSLLASVVACHDGGSATGGDGGGTASGSASTASGTAGSATSGGSVGTTGWPPGADCVNMSMDQTQVCYEEHLYDLPSEKVVFGDFDGDGHLDVAARIDGQGTTGDQLAFVAGKADGTFADATPFDFATTPQSQGDPLSLGATRVLPGVDADWLFVTGTYGALGTIRSDLWWSRGTPSLDRFFQPTNAPVSGPWIGDFDGGGAQQLVFTGSGTDLSTLDLYGCSSSGCDPGGSQTASNPPAPPWTILAGDVTGDGLDDLVVVTRQAMGSDQISTARVMASSGNGFTTGTPITLGPALSAFRLVLEDATGDGLPDLVAIGDTGDTQADDSTAVLSIFPGDGAGGFGDAKTVDFASNINGMTIADVDADGLPDLVMRLGDIPYLGVVRGKGGGDFGKGPIYAISAKSTGLTGQLVPRWETAVADIDGDGHQDILTVVHRGNLSKWSLSALRART